MSEPEAITLVRSLLEAMIEDSRQRLSPERFVELHDEAITIVTAFEAICTGARRDAILIATAMLQLSVAEDSVPDDDRHPDRASRP